MQLAERKTGKYKDKRKREIERRGENEKKSE